MERRELVLPIEDLQLRASGDPNKKTLNLKGHAAVFDRLSHDLGGFRERIARNAFDQALASNPHDHIVSAVNERLHDAYEDGYRDGKKDVYYETYERNIDV